MARPTSVHPTPLELSLLRILWKQSPLTVREIRDVLAESGKDLAHTSVITTLNTMVRKKYLTRTRQGKSFLFSPGVPREDVSEQMLGDVVERVFDGSAAAVMASLFNTSDIDSDELRELRRLINRRLKEQSE